MLLDQFGRPYKKGVLKAPVSRSGYHARRVRDARFYGELTPGVVDKALKAADRGDPRQFQRLMDRLEDRDGHYTALLQTRRMAVVDRPFRVVPGGRGRKARIAAEYCQEVIDSIPNFEEECQALLAAIARGYKHAQIIWDKDEWVPVGLEEWDPGLFIASEDDPYTLKLLTEDSPSQGEPLAPGAWIELRYRAKHGLPLKAGLGRIALWYHLFKQFSIKDWLTFSELYGTPARLGYYRQGIQDEDKRILERAVRGFGHDLAALLPDGTRIEFPDAGSKTASVDIYDRMKDYCNGEMSKALLGQTMTTEQGDKGARSLGEVYERKEGRLLAHDARALAGALQVGLLRPTVQFRYGETYPIPRLEVDLQDRKRLLERVKTLTSLGLPVERRWLYDTFGIPAPPGEEDGLLGGEPKAQLREDPGGKHRPSEVMESYL